MPCFAFLLNRRRLKELELVAFCNFIAFRTQANPSDDQVIVRILTARCFLFESFHVFLELKKFYFAFTVITWIEWAHWLFRHNPNAITKMQRFSLFPLSHWLAFFLLYRFLLSTKTSEKLWEFWRTETPFTSSSFSRIFIFRTLVVFCRIWCICILLYTCRISYLSYKILVVSRPVSLT